MPREYKFYLQDMLSSVEKIERYLGEASFEDIIANDMAWDATLHNLMIIGEAAKHIPDEIRAKYPGVRWRDIGRFRDFVVHEYFGLDLEAIRDILENELSALQASLDSIMAQEN